MVENKKRNWGWKEFLVGLAVGLVAALTATSYLQFSGSQGIHPGIDFPASWVENTPGADGYMEVENAQRNKELGFMKHRFEKWCFENSMPVDRAMLDAINPDDVWR